MSYEDTSVQADDRGITIARYGVTRAAKQIPYAEVLSATVRDIGRTDGRWRLIGAGPRRIRSWYNWDRSRRTKTRAVELDTGRFFRPTVTPDDTDAFVLAISDHVTMA